MNTVNELYVFLTGFILCFKKTFLLLHTVLLKCFIQRAELGHLSFSMVQQFLSYLVRIRSRRILFPWLEKVFLPFKLFTTSPYEKPNHKKDQTYLVDSLIPHAYWRNTLAYNICHRVDIYRFKNLTSSFY